MSFDKEMSALEISKDSKVYPEKNINNYQYNPTKPEKNDDNTRGNKFDSEKKINPLDKNKGDFENNLKFG